ncbi:MAG: YcxB family protein [Coprococcus sp.]
MENVEFKIKLSVTDLYYFMMYHYYTKISGIFGIVLSLAALIILCIRFSSLDSTGKMLLIIIALLFTVINPVMLWTKAAGQITSNKSLGGELTYALDGEHLVIKLGEEQADIPWEQVTKVKDNGRELVVYVTAARGYIWPKRQIREQYDHIIACLKKNVDAGKIFLKDK